MADVKRISKIVVLAVLVLGLAYPLAFVGLSRIVHSRADGNIVSQNGKPVGAQNIGQEFTSPGFFHGRPSAAGDGYDAMKSGGSNLGPNNPQLLLAARARIAQLKRENPGLKTQDIPVELVTSSASGLDPNISPESALMQVPRIAASRHLSRSALRKLISTRTHGRFLGIFGQPTVNVLDLNVELVKLQKSGGQ